MPLFIALEKGYFKDEGLDVQITPFQQGIDQLPALTNGQLDIGSTGPDPGYFNAFARGIQMKVTGFYEVVTPANKGLAMLVRKDLVDSGKYQSPKDLKGLNFGVISPNSSNMVYVKRFLAKDGLTLKDVNLVTLPFPDMLPAITNKRVDVVEEIQPFILQAENQSLAKSVATSGELVPGAPQFMLLYTPDFMTKQPEAARRFMVAFMRGQRDLWHAFDKGDGDKNVIYQILSKYTAIKDPKQNEALAATGVLSGTLPNGEMPLDGVSAFQDFFLESGTQTQKIDLNTLVDHSWADYAVQQLGKLQ